MNIFKRFAITTAYVTILPIAPPSFYRATGKERSKVEDKTEGQERAEGEEKKEDQEKTGVEEKLLEERPVAETHREDAPIAGAGEGAGEATGTEKQAGEPGRDGLTEAKGAGLSSADQAETKPQEDADFDLVHAGLSKYLPSVGLLLGFILAFLATAFLILRINSLISAVLLTVTWLWLTGALHMDGLMDTADGVFSHRNRERMLSIMQDSRVGNFGALTGFCTVLLKVAALHSLKGVALPIILLLAPVWGRWAEFFAIGRFSYARPHGKGKIWHDTTKYPLDLIPATLIPLLVTGILTYLGFEFAGLYAVVALITGMWVSYYLNFRLGGHTGDTYGAVVELTETISMVVCVFISSLLVQ